MEPSSGSLHVREWSAEEFGAAADAWTELLADSRAHPLFLSWPWQHGWWANFVAPSAAEPRILAVYASPKKLVGIAPMRIESRRLKGTIPIRRLTFLCGDCEHLDGMMTEYLGFVLRRGWEEPAAAALARACLQIPGWDEAWFDLTPSGSPALQALRSNGSPDWTAYNSPWGHLVSYQISTRSGNLETYKRALSPSTRRRLFNLRKRLIKEHGEPMLEYAALDSVDQFIDELNALHALRWGRGALSGRCLDFVAQVCREKARAGELAVSRLVIGGVTRSVLLNVRTGSEECNLQSGYDPHFDHKLPLGYLHLGYAIEEAFRNPRLGGLDLLGGEGKNTNYKAALATDQARLDTLHVVKHPALRVAYGLWRYKPWAQAS